MNLPGKKVVWDGLIILFVTDVNLFARTFVKILKLTFNRLARNVVSFSLPEALAKEL